MNKNDADADAVYYVINGSTTKGLERGIQADLDRGKSVFVHNHKHGDPCDEECLNLDNLDKI